MESNVLESVVCPQTWQEALATAAAVNSHIILSGNTRDRFPSDQAATFLSLDATVWRIMHAAGFQALLKFDPIAGLQVLTGQSDALTVALEKAGLTETKGKTIEEIIEAASSISQIPVALLIDYASHLPLATELDRERFWVHADQIARRAPPRAPWDDRPRNPIIWIVEEAGDFPDWFIVGNHTLRQIEIDLPDLEERFAFARTIASKFHNSRDPSSTSTEAAIQLFALQSEGMTLNDMEAVATVAKRHELPITRSDIAIRNFRTGSRRNPWSSPLLQSRLKEGRAMLANRIKGQDHAINHALDILVRSTMGLSGSQTSSGLNRPRGVLFFAGPTGVGKTELAKAITELLFGDETLMHRFDMTEFNSERSVTRLVGAPPGYTGHETGGELTNAVRRRPFNVILFDEVEKAHARVLDMFLQILDEGRLTDSRGETSYFSESLIIFTSNVGIFGKDHADNMGMEILPSDSFEELERKMLKGVRDHFKFTMQRPELMNRIGQNIVVFDFIHGQSANLIFDAILERVLGAVEAEHGIKVVLTDEARTSLVEYCVSDLFEGGRGIGNRIESNLINPLARHLFALDGKRKLTVEAVLRDGSDTTLVCR